MDNIAGSPFVVYDDNSFEIYNEIKRISNKSTVFMAENYRNKASYNLLYY